MATMRLDELDAVENIDPSSGKGMRLDEFEKLSTWTSAKNAFLTSAENFGKGFASDLARIPDQIGQIFKETGEKGGAGLAIPSFIDGVNLARNMMGKQIERGPQDEALIKVGEMLSTKNKEFVDRMNLKPEEGSQLAQVSFDLGQGASTVATSIGLMYTTRSPALLFGLFGSRQKAELYKEATEAGKDPETASIISSAGGLIEGGIEAVGGMAFLKGISLNKFVVRALVQAGREGMEEALQQGGEEILTQTTGIRKDSLQNTLLRVGYSATLGVVLGAPVGLIHTSQEKSGLKKEIMDHGFTDEQATKIMEKVTEKTVESKSVNQEIANFLEEEMQKTEKMVNENPEFRSAELLKEEIPAEQILADEEQQVDVTEEDESFDFGKNVEAEIKSIEERPDAFSESERKAFESESEAAFLKDRLEFRNQVGKIKRFKKGFLKEEMRVIPSSYFTNDPNASDLDERAADMGFESGEDLRNAIIAFEKFRPGAEGRLKELQGFIRDYGKLLTKNKKAVSSYVKNVGGYLKKNLPSSQTKNVVREKTGQTDLSPKKVTEMQALKANLRAQARAALQSHRATKADLKALKQGLTDTIKTIVPASGQGKFLSMIASAESGRDILSVMNRVEKVADDITRKQLTGAIKKQVKRIKASKSIAIDYIEKIQDFVNNFDFQKRTSGTVLSLLETQRHLDEQRLAGEDVSLPQYILNKLQILERQPLENIDTATLQNILNDIGKLAEIGKTKLRSLQALQETKKEQAINDLLAGSKKIENKDIIRPKIGEELTAAESRKNTVSKFINKAQAIDLSITPMDAIFDMLDGTKGYSGPNYRIFKNTVDQSYSEYLNKKNDWNQSVIDVANELDLKDADFEKIGFYAAKVQEGGIQKLESLGFTQQEIESINLDEKQMKWYDTARRVLDIKARPEVAETMREVYNEQLGNVKNYFPFMTDFEEMTDFEIRERFGNNVQEFGQMPRKNAEKGFTKKRVGGKQKIKLHAMEIFLRHIDNAAYLVTVGKETKWLGELAKTEEYKSAVGDKGQEMVADWIDTVARKGKMAGERHNAFDTLRKNVGIATLGLKLSSTLIQPTALMDGASLVGPTVFEGARNIAVDPNWRKFVFDNMPEVRARIGDDPAYQDFGGKTFIDKAGQVAFWALQKLDALTASSVGVGAYLRYMREKGLEIDLATPNPEAIDYAQRMVRRTQASAFFKDAPQAVTRGKLTGNRSIDRLILQFQTFMLGRWSMIRHDGYALGFKSGNMAQGLNVMTWMILATAAERGIRWFSKELVDLLVPGEDDKEEDDGITKAIVQGVLEKVPFASQIMSAFSYGSVPVPSLSFMNKAFNTLGAFAKSKQPETKIKNAARALTLLSGLFGIPGAVQADQIIGKIDTKESKGTGRSSRATGSRRKTQRRD